MQRANSGPASLLDKLINFANSWFGWGLFASVTIGPVALGYWAYQVEDGNYCIVNDEATVDELTACSTTGLFARTAKECLKVYNDDGTDVVS